MALPVDICNWGLLRLGQPRVSSIEAPFTDAAGVSSALAFLYPLIRDAELRAHPWSFARKRAELSADGTDPAFGFDRQFTLPSDFIRFLQIEQNDWQIEGTKLLTNDDAPLEFIYIWRVENSHLHDPLFNEALSCQIALGLTEKLTTSNAKKAEIKDDYRAAITRAKLVNAIERPQLTPPEDSFVTVRR